MRENKVQWSKPIGDIFVGQLYDIKRRQPCLPHKLLSFVRRRFEEKLPKICDFGSAEE